MMNNPKPKSATVAGLLGIFLGTVGAHNWYLGEKKKGIIHVCLAGASIVFEVISAIITATTIASGSISGVLGGAAVTTALASIGGLAAGASGLWGLIEGIQILVGGDAGLAAKGYATSQPAQPMYGQPAQPMYGQPVQSAYGQPVQPMQPMQPMQPVQPIQPEQPQINQ